MSHPLSHCKSTLWSRNFNIFHFLFSPTHTQHTRMQVTATDGDKDRPQNIVYFLTGQGIDPDNPANSKFDINRTTGEIFVLKVSLLFRVQFSAIFKRQRVNYRQLRADWCRENSLFRQNSLLFPPFISP